MRQGLFWKVSCSEPKEIICKTAVNYGGIINGSTFKSKNLQKMMPVSIIHLVIHPSFHDDNDNVKCSRGKSSLLHNILHSIYYVLVLWNLLLTISFLFVTSSLKRFYCCVGRGKGAKTKVSAWNLSPFFDVFLMTSREKKALDNSFHNTRTREKEQGILCWGLL